MKNTIKAIVKNESKIGLALTCANKIIKSKMTKIT